MKQKRLKNYLKLGILIFGTSLLFTYCQKDDTSSGQDENAETLQNNIKSSYVSGDEIPDIINLLGHDSNTTSRIDASKSSTVSSPFGSISIENILEVIDTLGNKKYSFKLTPKTPKTNSIFNLVIDASNEPINIAILEYRMAPNFAQDYHDGLKTFSEFTGSIIKFPFSPDIASNSFTRTSGDTCIQNIDEVVDCSIINIDGGTATVGGNAGSTTLYDTNTFTGANGGSSGASGGGTYVVWVCTCGETHSNPSNCICDNSSGGSGSMGAQGTWIIVIYPDIHANRSSTENCCDETVVVGEIGINFFDLAIEIRTALNIPGRSQEGLWLTAYATDTQLAELNNYIENNKDSDGNLSSEEQEFAIDVIEANINSPFKSVDLFDFAPDDNINLSQVEANAKFMCIYNKLANSPSFKNLFIDTFNESSDMHITFKLFDGFPDSQAAVTSPDNLYSASHQTITLNANHLNTKHPLTNAQTIIHEALHAFLNYKQADGECDGTNSGPSIYDLESLTLGELLNDFNYNCLEQNTNDHNLMFNLLVPAMEEMLLEVFNDLVASEDVNPIQYFFIPPNGEQHAFTWEKARYNMSLVGLGGATAFNDSLPNNSPQKYLFEQYNIRVNSNAFNKLTCEE